MDGADGVYPSSEDSFLLIDALQNDLQFINKNVSPCPFCIEIGCGSGEVTLALTSMFPGTLVLSTDVNLLALTKTQKLLQSSSPARVVDVVRADLFHAFSPATCFDVIVFNPPYVPTDNDELRRALVTRDIAASWAGGPSGRYVIDKFLDFLPNVLADRGVAYIVLLEENNPGEIINMLHGKNFVASVVLKRNAGIESLCVMRITSFISNK